MEEKRNSESYPTVSKWERKREMNEEECWREKKTRSFTN
jgi:hypothetical protein